MTKDLRARVGCLVFRFFSAFEPRNSSVGGRPAKGMLKPFVAGGKLVQRRIFFFASNTERENIKVNKLLKTAKDKERSEAVIWKNLKRKVAKRVRTRRIKRITP